MTSHQMSNSREDAKVGQFKMWDRVRIKFGSQRGCCGRIEFIGGDDGTYYGVLLDADTKPVGYSEYELERE